MNVTSRLRIHGCQVQSCSSQNSSSFVLDFIVPIRILFVQARVSELDVTCSLGGASDRCLLIKGLLLKFAFRI